MGERPFALARKASGAAGRRLRELHYEEYEAILSVEREKLGLPPMAARPDYTLYAELNRLRERVKELEG